MQELDSSVVHRNLDTKLKIAGLEALDLLLVLVISAFLGLFFDAGKLGFIFIFLIPLSLLIALYLIKRNKPDGYIKDTLKFHLSHGHFLASEDLRQHEKLITRIIKKENP